MENLTNTELLEGIGQKLAGKIPHAGIRFLTQTLLIPSAVALLAEQLQSTAPKQEEETIDVVYEVVKDEQKRIA